MRYVRTNKAKEGEPLQPKSRIVTPGDVDPDGEKPVEDGGFRTDAPTCPQIAFHYLCSQAVLKKRKLGSIDCKTAFLTGKEHDRDIYCHPPKEGLVGVPEGSLLKLVKGAHGLREKRKDCGTFEQEKLYKKLVLKKCRLHAHVSVFMTEVTQSSQ